MIALPEKVSRSSAIAASLLALVLVGLIDYATGRFAVVLLYFLPVGIGAWYLSRTFGIVLSFLSAVTWFMAYVAHEYHGKAAAAWDTAITLGIFICYSLLLSALRSARVRMQKGAEELARSNRDLQQFAYVASHDLQEPLRTIKGFLQLLEQRSGEKLDPTALEYIRYAIDSSDRMNRLISDLLAYSRINTQERVFENVDCNIALSEALRHLQMAIRESNAVIQYDSLPTVKGMHLMLVQLFQNLVGNAIKFRERQRALVVRIEAVPNDQEGNEWKFEVRDNGIGIAPENQERIFGIFHRLHRQQEYPGTGIGLAVCKRIVEQHGGKIWVESQPGTGSAFLFTIPS
jgi:light-regulated signal transduction histidine kinase (bacteriophytochrome)